MHVPVDRVRREANVENHDTMLPHSSYRHHRQSDPRLEINVTLSPDCTRCHVTVNESTAARVSNPNETKKRLIVDTTNTSEEDNGSKSASKRQKVSVTSSDGSYGDQQNGLSASIAEEATTTAALTNMSPRSSVVPSASMEVKDIVSHLSKALPDVIYETESNVASAIEDGGYLQQMHGKILFEYKRNIPIGDENEEAQEGDFIITLANGSEEKVAEFHSKVQKLAIFFIETADNVDLTSNEGGGYWRVMQLYRRHAEGKFSLVGYMTLFHFTSPFKKPKPGIILRVCQALILPPYQRGGHGSMMLNHVYYIAEGYYDAKLKEKGNLNDTCEVVEVNVEDPAPSFVALRNKIDFERFKESLTSMNSALECKFLGCCSVGASGTDIENEAFWLPLPESQAIIAAAKLRITPQQIIIAHEIFKLYVLEAYISRLSGSIQSIEGLEKKYRLMVKKRLLKLHREEFSACSGKEEQKAKLGQMFDDTLRQYRSLLKRTLLLCQRENSSSYHRFQDLQLKITY